MQWMKSLSVGLIGTFLALMVWYGAGKVHYYFKVVKFTEQLLLKQGVTF
jgi:hypothetical protein